MTTTRPQPHPVARRPLWFGFLAGPIIWSIHLSVTYFVVTLACTTRVFDWSWFGFAGAEIVHTLASVIALGAVGFMAYWTSTLFNRAGGTQAYGDSDGAAGRSRFMALGGLLMNGLFFIAILAAAVPGFFLGVCAVE